MTVQDGKTRDACIRTPLLAWLKDQHEGEELTELLEEFKIPRPSARIDVAVVNGELAGFEIKSDSDTLNRLPTQTAAFSRFFDRVSLVTTSRHLSAARGHIPEWWGLILFEDGGFHFVRTPKINRDIDVRALLFALSKKEIAEIGRRASVLTKSTAKKGDLVEQIATHVPMRKVRDLARDVLRQRRTNAPRHHRPPSSPA